MNIVASIAPCLYPPKFRYRSEWVPAAPDDSFTALAFVADVQGPASVHVTLEQATDEDGAGYKPARGTPLPALLLPQQFDGYITHHAGHDSARGRGSRRRERLLLCQNRA